MSGSHERANADQDRVRPAARVHRDLIAGGALLLFCAAAFVVTLGFEEAPSALAQNVQPATFPRLVIVVLAAFGVLLLVSALRGLGRKTLGGLERPVYTTAAAMIAFLLAVQVLGMFISAFLFCVLFPSLWGEMRPLVQLTVGAGFAAALYLVFVVLLNVHFEPGPLGF